MLRYLRSIILERGDYNGRILSVAARRPAGDVLAAPHRRGHHARAAPPWGALVDGSRSNRFVSGRGAGDSVAARAPGRAEVRRHVGRRPRAHPRGRRPRRPHQAPRRRRRRGRQRHGQGDRRAHPPRRPRCRKVRPGREMDMLITAGERKATALLCMALHDLGVPADSFTGSQAGFITDTTHTNAKIVELRPERLEAALRRGPHARWSAARRACPPSATSRSSGGAAPTPPRWRWPTPSAPTRASSTPTSPACSPPTRAWCPPPAAWRR